MNAGRILIMPKGDWNAETEYEMLDLVCRDGKAWVSKKASVGIEPTKANEEYWQDMCDITAENAEAVQRTIWKWVANDGGSLFSFIKDKLAEGYTCGMIQVEIASGALADVPESIKARVRSSFMCSFQRHYNDYVRATIWGDESAYEYSAWGILADDSWKTDWYERVHPNGYLPKSGGTLNGILHFNDGKGLIYANDNYAFFEAKKDGQNYRHLEIANPITTATSDNDLIKLEVANEGLIKNYRIFGEHNIDLLNQYIDERIAEKMK